MARKIVQSKKSWPDSVSLRQFIFRLATACSHSHPFSWGALAGVEAHYRPRLCIAFPYVLLICAILLHAFNTEAGQRESPPYGEGLENPMASLQAADTNATPDSTQVLHGDQYESLAGFDESSRFRRIGRTIVFIGIVFEDKQHLHKVGTCTGAVVSPIFVITARHCLREFTGWSPIKILASIDYHKSHEITGGSYPLSVEPVEEDEGLDYVLLRVNDGLSIQIGEYVDLRSALDPFDGQSLFLVHHPSRRPQRLSRVRCQGVNPSLHGYNNPSFKDRWGHRCLTENGSSGAIIFDENTMLPVALHIQGGFDSNDPKSISVSVPLSKILSRSEELKKLTGSFVDVASSGTRLPFVSHKACENAASISIQEVSDYLFGVKETATRDKETFDLKAAADGYAYRPMWITGDEGSTRWSTISRFFGLYFQGSNHFLKIQKFLAPENAKRLRAFSFSGSASGSDHYTPMSWVFSVTADSITQKRSYVEQGQRVFSIRGVSAGTDIYVVAVYPNAKAMLSKAEEVWVEVDDLAGRIDNTSIIFGGLVKEVDLSRAYEMTSDIPQRFCQINSERIGYINRGHEQAVKEIGGFMSNLLTTLDVQQESSIQPSWELVKPLWNEFLESGKVGIYSGLTVRDAKHDLLFFAVGSPLE